MKICPHCNLKYSDNTLEFCLEDGAKLLMSQNLIDDSPTISNSNRPNSSSEETAYLPKPNFAAGIEFNNLDNETIKQKPVSDTIKTNLLNTDGNLQKFQVLETAPIIIALAHNWWQWLYLNNQYYSSFSAYVFSANFLMWLLLLISGIIVGLFAIKYCRNKNFAYTSLIILSINLLLILVPKR